MADIRRIPTVIVHEIGSGGALDGSLPDGNDSEETLFRGRYRLWDSCTVGGGVKLPEPLSNVGFRVERVSWKMTGLTGVNLYLKDPDGFLYLVGAMTGAEGYYDWINNGVLVPGGDWTFQAISQGGTLSADGRIMIVIGQGWGQPTPCQTGIIGQENVPPTMQRS